MQCERCHGKCRHTFRRAEMIARRARRRGERMQAYPCPHGTGYHVGHSDSTECQRKHRGSKRRKGTR